MTQARQNQVALDATPYYHCMVRCVRRAFLCGDDAVTGQCYDHRKQWLVSRMRFLSYVYAIDICAYAVMSNHYHVVLHVDVARAAAWNDVDVVERWLQLYKGTLLVSRWLERRSSLSSAELETVADTIGVWRERLTNISWFMRGINETIARMANDEDGCKGRFWEGRFKSQALLDEVALLSCMAYVDLNPVRVALANDLESSDFTSIQQRLCEYASESEGDMSQPLRDALENQQNIQQALNLADLPQSSLMPFSGSAHTSVHTALPFTREDYFQLVDETGRIIRHDKRGFIPNNAPPLIDSYGIDPNQWLLYTLGFELIRPAISGHRVK